MKRKPNTNLLTELKSLPKVDKLRMRQDAMERPLPGNRQILQAQITDERKRVEEDQYREREGLFVTLNSIGDAVITSDMDGRITFLNPVAATLTGWNLEEVLGQPIKTIFRIINEKTHAPAEDVVKQVLNEKRVFGLVNDTVLVAKNGRKVPIEDSAAPIKDSAGNMIGIVLVFHDVTEKRHAQAELRKAYEQAVWLARFPEQNPQPVIQASANGTVLYCNPASARLPGWTCKVGQILQNELVPLVDRAIVEGKEVRHDLKLSEKFYMVWVVPFPEEGYATIYSRDITERKWIEEALRNSEEISRQRMQEIENLYHNAPVGLCMLDRELRWVRINDRMAEINGIPVADSIGKRVRDLMPDLADAVEPGMWRVIETGEPRLNIEVESQTPAQPGVTRSWLEQWLPIKDAQGNVVGLNIVVEETTAHKKAMDALRQIREDLDHAQAVGQIGSWRLDVGRNVLTWSDENHRIFGVPKGTTLDYETFLGAVHPDDRPYVDTQWKAGLAGRPSDIEHRIVADGQVKWVREKAHLEFDDAGNLRGGFGITQEITERKKLEEALKEANAKLEERVEERTAELQKALAEICTLKDNLEAENICFRNENKLKHQYEHIIGQSDALRYVLYRVEQVAPTSATALVLGETGTGKELIAFAIHNMSPRKKRAMITVNCAALPINLIESELFGREKGAFTGADTRQIGRFEVAHDSTLCLDEIGELPLELQAKLLRAIQHGEFERLGSSHTVKVNVRIIATTNRDLEEEVRKGRFRQDLYYRLNVFPITVPPLRQRKEDIPLMAQAFVERYSRKWGKQITSIHKETMRALQDYPWPGNVRELESIIERAVILCPGPTLHLADKLETSSRPLSSVMRTLEETERNQILNILSETRWRIEGKDGAAAILGLHPSTLRARMHKLGIVRPETQEQN